RDAALPVADAGRQHVVTLAEHHVERRIALARARFETRDGIGNGARYRRRGHRFWRDRVGRGAGMRRTQAGGESDRDDERKRGGECAAGSHCCNAGSAATGASAATPCASICKIRCLTAAASSYTAIAYRALWL